MGAMECIAHGDGAECPRDREAKRLFLVVIIEVGGQGYCYLAGSRSFESRGIWREWKERLVSVVVSV